MLKKVKQDLFTITGILTTLIHLFIVVGAITTIIIFQTQVLGIQPTLIVR